MARLHGGIGEHLLSPDTGRRGVPSRRMRPSPPTSGGKRRPPDGDGELANAGKRAGSEGSKKWPVGGNCFRAMPNLERDHRRKAPVFNEGTQVRCGRARKLTRYPEIMLG